MATNYKFDLANIPGAIVEKEGPRENNGMFAPDTDLEALLESASQNAAHAVRSRKNRKQKYPTPPMMAPIIQVPMALNLPRSPLAKIMNCLASTNRVSWPRCAI